MLRTRMVITAPTGSPYLCVMHFTASTEDQAAADNAIAKTKNFWNAFASVWATTVSATNLPNVDLITAATGSLVGQLTVTVATTTGVVSGSDFLPPATQALIRWNTADFVNGRRVRGRTFIPALLESANGADGRPAGQLVTTNVPNALAALLAAGASSFVTWSRPFAGRTLPTPIPARSGTTHLVTTGTLQPQFAVLRSRRDN